LAVRGIVADLNLAAEVLQLGSAIDRLCRRIVR
jgi:hypothetical protein